MMRKIIKDQKMCDFIACGISFILVGKSLLRRTRIICKRMIEEEKIKQSLNSENKIEKGKKDD